MLLRPRSILKTTSGKLRRRDCREAFLQLTSADAGEGEGAAAAAAKAPPKLPPGSVVHVWRDEPPAPQLAPGGAGAGQAAACGAGAAAVGRDTAASARDTLAGAEERRLSAERCSAYGPLVAEAELLMSRSPTRLRELDTSEGTSEGCATRPRARDERDETRSEAGRAGDAAGEDGAGEDGAGEDGAGEDGRRGQGREGSGGEAAEPLLPLLQQLASEVRGADVDADAPLMEAGLDSAALGEFQVETLPRRFLRPLPNHHLHPPPHCSRRRRSRHTHATPTDTPP